MKNPLAFRAAGWLVVLSCLVPVSANAIQLEAGGEIAAISASNENDGTTTIVPVLAVGGEVAESLALLGEFGYLNYTVNKSGDRSNKVLSEGTIGITGVSLAAILVKRFEKVAARFGAGIIAYQFDNQLSSNVKAEIAQLGITNYTETLSNATGTQVLIGLDVLATPNFLLGIEYRNISVKPTATATGTIGGQTVSVSDTADLSNSWLGVRLMYRYGEG